MAEYELRPSAFPDISGLVGSLRYDDWAEITCFGLRPFQAIRQCYRESFIRRTAIANGEVVAMWGCAGNMLGTGQPWLLTGKGIENFKVSFIRNARKEVSEMLLHCNRLEGIVVNRYDRAVRLLEVLGFELSEPFELQNNLVRRYTLGGK